MKIISVIFAIAASLMWQAGAQTYDTNNDFVQTFAGSGFSGDVNGVGVQTMFNNPNSIVADSNGNLFVCDAGNSIIRKISPDGTVSTFAGGGNAISGYGTNVNLGNLYSSSLAIDHSNALWFVNSGGGVFLWRIGSDGYVSRTSNATGFSGSPETGMWGGICFDSWNNLYYAGLNTIYRLSTNGVLEVFAGSGNGGSLDGNGIFCSFSVPMSLACDSANNIYVWDSYSYKIRRIDQNQNVTTIAGSYYENLDGTGLNASFENVSSMCVDNLGDIILACGSCIRKIDARTNVVTIAGSFTQTGYTNGAENIARFSGANGVCISGGTIYVADSNNQRIRNITNNPTPQIVSGANLGIDTFAGVTITGVVGRTYQIQSAPDMNAWTTRATLLLNSSPYLWIDQNPVSGNKFYRAILLP
jgi:hypothetical protein